MRAIESMEYIPEKMEYSEGLNINEILSEARRKLLKYQRKKWSTEQEDLKEGFISDDEKCPECQALMELSMLRYQEVYISMLSV